MKHCHHFVFKSHLVEETDGENSWKEFQIDWSRIGNGGKAQHESYSPVRQD